MLPVLFCISINNKRIKNSTFIICLVLLSDELIPPSAPTALLHSNKFSSWSGQDLNQGPPDYKFNVLWLGQCLVLIQNESKIHIKHTNWTNNTYKLSNTPMTGYSYELWSLPFLLCFSLTNSSCFLLKSSIMDCRVEKLQVNSFSIIVKHLLDLISLTLLKRKHMSLEAVSNLTNVLQLWPRHTV